MALTGSIAFLDVGTGASADVTWLCVITNTTTAAPQVQVRRSDANKKPGAAPTKNKGKLALSEGNLKGGKPTNNSATGDDSGVTLQLTGDPTAQGSLFVWEVLLTARPGGVAVTFQLFGTLPNDPSQTLGTPSTLLAAQSATSLQRPQLNANSAAVLQLQESPVPRLSVGLNQATPATPPDFYTVTRDGKTISADPSAAEMTSSGAQAVATTGANAIRGTAAALQPLLFRIFYLLDTPGTLDTIWDQQTLTLTTTALGPLKFNADPVRVAEELWARQVTEMLSFTPYGGPAANYGSQGITDADLLTKGIEGGSAKPQYGLYFACQHLATFGVVSRGFAQVPPNRDLGAGAGCAVTVNQMGGQWLNGTTTVTPLANPTGDPAELTEDPKTPVDLTTIMKSPLYGPGSIHLFSNRPARPTTPSSDPKFPTEYEKLNDDFQRRVVQSKPASASVLVDTLDASSKPVKKELTITANGTKYTWSEAIVRLSRSKNTFFVADNTASPEVPHVGFVLRVRKSGVQPFDTGGFGGQSTGATVQRASSRGLHIGNFDYPLTTTINGGQPFQGTGVFPLPTAATAAQMRTHVLDVLRKARPMGLARLVLLDSSLLSNQVDASDMLDKALLAAVVYASKLMTMYLNDDLASLSNYSISRYMWSLRNLPGASSVTAVWMLYIPIGKFAPALRDSKRADTALKVANLAGSALVRSVSPIGDVLSQPGGTVLLIGPAGRSAPHALHRLEQRGLLPMEAMLSGDGSTQNFPPYFAQ
jgi:hypothetical protein